MTKTYGLTAALLTMMTLCALNPLLAQTTKGGTPGGVYFGVVSLAENAWDLTGGAPIHLDPKGTGYNRIMNGLNQYTRTPNMGTALYYGVHKAMANLSAYDANLPPDLSEVYFITFTDGLDITSTDRQLEQIEPNQSFTRTSTAGYQTYIQNQIQNRGRTFNGGKVGINAWALGVQGSDVNDVNQLTVSLQALASNRNQSMLLENFEALGATLSRIADELVVTETTRYQRFDVRTTAFEDGTRVRMTFGDLTTDRANPNNPANAVNARSYLDGTMLYNETTKKYMLTDIQYGGAITASVPVGSSVSQGSSTTEISYPFDNFDGYDLTSPGNNRLIRQWFWSPSMNNWQANTEYQVGSAANVTTTKRTKSVVIYFVLDRSWSMSTESIDQVRGYISNFITSIYNQVKDVEPTPAPIPQTARVVEPTPTPAPAAPTYAPAPKPAVSDFTTGDRLLFSLVNPISGIGSFIMGDWPSGLIIGGLELTGIIMMIVGTIPEEHYEENYYSSGYGGSYSSGQWVTTYPYEDMLYIGLGVYAVGIIWGYVAPWLYHRPGSTVAFADTPLKNLDIGIAPDARGKAALRMSYKISF